MRRPALKQNFISASADPTSLARLINEMWQYLREALTPFVESPRALTNVIEVDLVYAVDGGGDPIPNVINHLLTLPTGKTPEGWCVTDIDQPVIVYRTDWDSKTISLFPASADCHIKFEVW